MRGVGVGVAVSVHWCETAASPVLFKMSARQLAGTVDAPVQPSKSLHSFVHPCLHRFVRGHVAWMGDTSFNSEVVLDRLLTFHESAISAKECHHTATLITGAYTPVVGRKTRSVLPKDHQLHHIFSTPKSQESTAVTCSHLQSVALSLSIRSRTHMA